MLLFYLLALFGSVCLAVAADVVGVLIAKERAWRAASAWAWQGPRRVPPEGAREGRSRRRRHRLALAALRAVQLRARVLRDMLHVLTGSGRREAQEEIDELEDRERTLVAALAHLAMPWQHARAKRLRFRRPCSRPTCRPQARAPAHCAEALYGGAPLPSPATPLPPGWSDPAGRPGAAPTIAPPSPRGRRRAGPRRGLWLLLVAVAAALVAPVSADDDVAAVAAGAAAALGCAVCACIVLATRCRARARAVHPCSPPPFGPRRSVCAPCTPHSGTLSNDGVAPLWLKKGARVRIVRTGEVAKVVCVDPHQEPGATDVCVALVRAGGAPYDTFASRVEPAVGRPLTVFVTGLGPTTHTVALTTDASVESLMGALQHKTGVPVGTECCLNYAARRLSTGSLLVNGVSDMATITVAPRAALLGGSHGRDRLCDYATKGGKGRDNCKCSLTHGCVSAAKEFGGEAPASPWVVLNANVKYTDEEHSDAVRFCKSLGSRAGAASDTHKQRLARWCYRLKLWNNGRGKATVEAAVAEAHATAPPTKQSTPKEKEDYEVLVRAHLVQRMRGVLAADPDQEGIREVLGPNFFGPCKCADPANHSEQCALRYAPGAGNVDVPATDAGRGVVDVLVAAGWMFVTKSTAVHCCSCHIHSNDASVVGGKLIINAGAVAKTQAMLKNEDDGVDRYIMRTRGNGMQDTNPRQYCERADVDLKHRAAMQEQERLRAAALAQAAEDKKTKARDEAENAAKDDMLNAYQALQVGRRASGRLGGLI